MLWSADLIPHWETCATDAFIVNNKSCLGTQSGWGGLTKAVGGAAVDGVCDLTEQFSGFLQKNLLKREMQEQLRGNC